MNLDSDDLLHLADYAKQAVRRAGQCIAGAKPKEVRRKSGAHSYAAQVVTEVDREAEEILIETLVPSVDRFDLGLLTEERNDDSSRLEKDFFWCIDPLDGTLPFIEGKPGYAVSVALVSRQGVPQIGVILSPADDILYCAVRGGGVDRNAHAWAPPAGDNTLSVFVDRSLRLSSGYQRVVDGLLGMAEEMGLSGVEIHEDGGAVMNACNALTSPPACYFKFPKRESGGGSLWDFAATACLFLESGAVATDIHGNQLELNRVDSTFMNHRGVLFASSSDLADHIRLFHEEK